MNIIIDKIEHDSVVIELPTGQTLVLPILLFPDATEGDVYCIEKNSAETEQRRKRIRTKMNQLFVE